MSVIGYTDVRWRFGSASVGINGYTSAEISCNMKWPILFYCVANGVIQILTSLFPGGQSGTLPALNDKLINVHDLL